MTHSICGIRIAYGIVPLWRDCQIVNLPSDTIRVKRRLRDGQAARAYVRRPGKLEDWVLAPDEGGGLRLQILRGVNVTNKI